MKLLEMLPITKLREFIYSDRLISEVIAWLKAWRIETVLNESQIIEPEVRKALDRANELETDSADEAQQNSFTDYLAQNRGSMTDDEVLCEVIGHMYVVSCDRFISS